MANRCFGAWESCGREGMACVGGAGGGPVGGGMW